MYESLVRSKDGMNDSETAIVSLLRQILVYQDSMTPLIAFGKSDVIELVIRTNKQLMVQLLFMTENDHILKGLLYHYHSCAKEHNTIYLGHTPVQIWGYEVPCKWTNVWNLDTGSGKYPSGRLSCLEVFSETIYQSDF
jgi:hypothetical protein